MKLQDLQEARYAVTRPNLDWVSQKDWDELTNDQKYFVASEHKILTDMRDSLIDGNLNWIDEHGGGSVGEGWEFIEQASETYEWDQLPDGIKNAKTDAEIEWLDPVFELIELSVWDYDYDPNPD